MSNLKKSRDFYLAALTPLGYGLILDMEDIEKWKMGITGCNFGVNGETRLWLSGEGTVAKCHIAFRAASQTEVEDFHLAAIAAGEPITAHPEFANSTPRTTTLPSYWTLTEITSRWFAVSEALKNLESSEVACISLVFME